MSRPHRRIKHHHKFFGSYKEVSCVSLTPFLGFPKISAATEQRILSAFLLQCPCSWSELHHAITSLRLREQIHSARSA